MGFLKNVSGVVSGVMLSLQLLSFMRGWQFPTVIVIV